MEKGLPILVVCLCICAAFAQTDIRNEFLKYIVKYGKAYKEGSPEFERRLANFKTNVIEQQRLNNASSWTKNTAIYGVTKFSDLSPQEFEELYLQDLKIKLKNGTNNHRLTPVYKLKSPVRPTKFDWRNKNAVSAVKNQRKCGACWAFSTVETVESMYAISRNTTPPTLSVQEVIDCADGNLGCSGGDICIALSWMRNYKQPLVSDEVYPLTDESNPCLMLPNGTKGVEVESYNCHRDLVGKEEEILKMLHTTGPVTVAVDARTWSNYQSGIIQWHCGNSNNHAVQIVGYDVSGDIPYYIVRNSWGTDFGHAGYLYIRIGNNVCGLAEEVATVEV